MVVRGDCRWGRSPTWDIGCGQRLEPNSKLPRRAPEVIYLFGGNSGMFEHGMEKLNRDA
jgi:hypothetical protein